MVVDRLMIIVIQIWNEFKFSTPINFLDRWICVHSSQPLTFTETAPTSNNSIGSSIAFSSSWQANRSHRSTVFNWWFKCQQSYIVVQCTCIKWTMSNNSFHSFCCVRCFVRWSNIMISQINSHSSYICWCHTETETTNCLSLNSFWQSSSNNELTEQRNGPQSRCEYYQSKSLWFG